MGALDLVVALQAVQAVLLLAIQILDDQAILDQVRYGVQYILFTFLRVLFVCSRVLLGGS